METAKVDIRKLQLLNDRINQCIDALAQVRLSVHGLSHSNPMQNIGQSGIGNNPFTSPSPGFGSQGFGTQNFGFGQPGIGQGYGMGQGTQGVFGQQAPWSQQQQGGLSHTTPDVLEYSRPTWADPYLAQKVYQTFPYAQLQIPPVVSLY